ncbi:hypothetical protein CFP56_011269, partial [Quercus suber]
GVLLKFLVHLSYGQLSNIGSSCCKAISEIEVNYLSNFFPFNPIFAPLLSNSCDVRGCLTNVMNSLFNGRISFFGTTCCKAITLVNDHCLPKFLIENNVS